MVTKKQISENKYEILVDVEEKKWLDAQEKAKKHLYQELEVNGFRKGHVPDELAKNHINAEKIFNEAINEILPTIFMDAIKEAELKPFIPPRVNVDKYSTTSLTLSFIVTTMPKINLTNYQKLGVVRDQVTVSDQEVDEEVKKALNNNIKLIVKNDKAVKGDTVIFDFDGSIDGKPFDGGSSKNFELVLGSGQFIPGFEEQLIGLKANDHHDVHVTFPDDYQIETLKGKKALFKCVIHEVKTPEMPTFTDEMVKKLAIPNVTTLAALKNYQLENLKKNKEKEADVKFFDQIIAKIIENDKITVDEEIINNEAEYTQKNLLDQLKNSGMSLDKYLKMINKTEDAFKQDLKDTAKKNITHSLVINTIIAKENITVTDDEIQKEYDNLAKKYRMEVAKIKEYLPVDGMTNQIKQRKVFDLLVNANK